MKDQIDKENHIVKTPLRMIDPYGYLNFFFMFIQVVAGWLSVSVEVFLRYDFGERYLSWVRLYFSYVTLGWVSLLTFSNRPQPLLGFAMSLFLILSLVHRGRISYRNRKGIKWYSYNAGISWLDTLVRKYVPFVSEAFMYRFGEPIFLWLISGIFVSIDPIFTRWLFCSSFALALHRQIEYSNQRNAVLDAIDSQIESKIISSIVDGNEVESIEESSGFTMVAVENEVSQDDTPTLSDMFSKVSPKLQAIIGKTDNSESTQEN